MLPAFSSTRQAAAFALFLSLCLFSPLLIRSSWLPPLERSYSSIPWSHGAFAYFDDQIFKEKSAIDVLLIGNSRIWWGVDTLQIQAKLSERLGRPAVVETFGWALSGLDRFYFVLHDLLQYREVRMIVFCNCVDGAGFTAHPFAPVLFRWPERLAEMRELSFSAKVSFYCSAIAGIPKNLLAMLRANLPAIASPYISWPGFQNLPSPFLHLGSLPVSLRVTQPFVEFTPPISASPFDVCIYSENTKNSFHFQNVPFASTQAIFARRIGEIARQNQAKLVYLHMTQLAELHSPTIDEQTFWPDFFKADVAMMGIPAPKLFVDLPEKDVEKLFYNSEHLNKNGQKYFTSVITPKLLELYPHPATN